MAVTAKLDKYLTQFPPMIAGKLRKTLEYQQGFNGKWYKRHVYAEMLWTSNKNLKIDPTKERVYTDSDLGTFFEYKDITKTFANYLAWLIYGQYN